LILIYKNSIFHNKDKEFKEEYDTETMLIIFKDSSFKDAVVKTNTISVLKQFGINEVMNV
jgi:adenine-specific DNA-methyltransferase